MQANNEAPKELKYMELNKLRENTDKVVFDDTDEEVEEVIEKINDDEIIDMPDDEFENMMKTVDEFKANIADDYEDGSENSKYHCLCGITVKMDDREAHFKSAEHFANISESENDEEIDDEPTENIIINVREPIACC
jgi:predicted SprT family Zn-dependent metalloprotease